MSIKSPKECFTDAIFDYLMDEFKHCNLDMQMNLQLVPVFWVYLADMLPFGMTFLDNVFFIILFACICRGPIQLS